MAGFFIDMANLLEQLKELPVSSLATVQNGHTNLEASSDLLQVGSSNGHTSLEKQTFPLEKENGFDRVPVPDPLEGVVKGENRYERYMNFVIGTLAEIWPPNTTSGEYGDDLWRAARFEIGKRTGVVEAYTHFSPNARDPLTLNPQQFETMVTNLGTPDYVRVRSVPPELLEPNVQVLPAGGSCVIETWGMRNLTDIKAAVLDGTMEPHDLSRLARTIVEFSPTASHISGALLSGQEASMHLVESDMWSERLKSYGIPEEEAEKLVVESYNRINDVIRRRAQLINPDATIIDINFDLLGLDTAVKQWFDNMPIDHDPTHRVGEVIYTYVGPQQLELAHNAIRQRLANGELNDKERVAAQELLQTTYHMRGKQIDHLRWGSMDLPKQVITGSRPMTEEEQEKYKNDYAYAMGIVIMSDVYQRHQQGTNHEISVGFADLPTFNNAVQHESRDVGITVTGQPGTPDFAASLEAQVNNPARLHRQNVDAHLQFLESYIIDSDTRRKELVESKGKILKEIKPVQQETNGIQNKVRSISEKVKTYERQIAFQQGIAAVMDYATSITEGELSEELRGVAQAFGEQKQLQLTKLQKQVSDGYGTDEVALEISQLPEAIAVLATISSGEKPVLSDTVTEVLLKYRAEAQQQDVNLSDLKQIKVVETSELAALIEERRQVIAPQEAQIRDIDIEIKQLGAKSSFPLSENPFVHHAMQFLWDPDFPAFLQEAVRIQKDRASNTISREVSNKQMREIQKQIYPKLASYINYLYARTDYPLDARQARVMADEYAFN